jgi:hypothetical protein
VPGILLGSFLMVWFVDFVWETMKSIGVRVDHAVMWWGRSSSEEEPKKELLYIAYHM